MGGLITTHDNYIWNKISKHWTTSLENRACILSSTETSIKSWYMSYVVVLQYRTSATIYIAAIRF